MRQHTIWFSTAHQELYQIDEQLRNTLLSLGTYILCGTSSMESARDLADALFSRDPWRVKYWRPVYGRRYSHSPLEVITEEPEFMALEEQTELFAQRIKQLGRFQFLLRPAIAEGHIGSAVLPLSIRNEDIDKETGTYQFPDTQLVARLRTALAKQAGIPITQLLQEQESRLPQALPAQPVRLMPSQPNGHQTAHRARAAPVASGVPGSTLPQRRDAQPEQEQQKAPETLGTNQIPRSGTQGRRRHRIA